MHNNDTKHYHISDKTNKTNNNIKTNNNAMINNNINTTNENNMKEKHIEEDHRNKIVIGLRHRSLV